MRVKMIKTMAPVEIPNGTEGYVLKGNIDGGVVTVKWDTGHVLHMFVSEIEVIP